MEYDVGVLVGRFQVPSLHLGHKQLIGSVLSKHKKIIIFIGVSPVKNTSKNPLDFMTRCNMILEEYPTVYVLPIKDQPDDQAWSVSLDTAIRDVCLTETIVLYGSKDSFIPRYFGKFATIALPEAKSLSGTEIRLISSRQVRCSEDFREGVIYGAYNKYPISYTTVDAVITKDKQFLLARKANEPKYRFVGGFVDIGKDDCLENAIKREVIEETGGIAIGNPKYIGSAKINDWRYQSENDGIMTSLFVVPYLWGKINASDDIVELRWFTMEDDIDIMEYASTIVAEHLPLLVLFNKHVVFARYCENCLRSIDESEPHSAN